MIQTFLCPKDDLKVILLVTLTTKQCKEVYIVNEMLASKTPAFTSFRFLKFDF